MSGSLEFPMSSVNFNSETMNVKEEINSREDELGLKFIPDIHPTQTSVYHLVPDVEIKAEEIDFHHNHNSTTDPDENQFDLEIVSSIPHLDFVSVNAEENDLNEFYVDLLQCQRDCGTCKKYLRLLSEHVKSTHCPSQPTQDPLYIDPLNVDPDLPYNHQSSSSPIQIKCEVDESIDKINCSEENSKLNSESGQDSESENERELVSDTYYKVSPHVTPNVCRRGVNKNNPSIDSKTPKSDQPSRKEFKCNECDKTFSTTSNLGKHMRIHAGVKSFKCNECEKYFSGKYNLTEHMKIHAGEKPHKCDACEKSFRRPGDLTRHQGNHTGKRPHKCDTCEKTFSQKSTLSVHKLVHTGERPHKCDECERSFARMYRLNQHKKLHNLVRNVQV